MKINKKITILSLVLALMFSFILTSNVHASANNGFKKGNPKILVRKGVWQTGYIKHGGNKKSKFAFDQPGYNKSLVSFFRNYGGSSITINYNMKKKETGGGLPSSAVANMNPHYKYIGNNYYIIKTGGMPDKHHDALYYELNDSMVGETILVKVHDKNHIYIWSFYSNKPKNNKLNSKKSYEGYFIYNNK
ncbi:hypothetical protein DY138_02705 [Apilactobacillus timberlakei]|uniref:hypothetical protein n=1 Tax=Apilactobacillus timberlakei TaxID=2008380 RepID=UPI001129F954|nr:hypothetical protein [Apilactobacillus timberlakei]TPR19572.1 hypothetical protein DY138_02705 [Apilactobacillus timberlakei]TPR20549.1 hypothetical protein DY061_04345 [Apilactobacillus timberlakei]TPR22593.1 hypothetical protein DY083_03615 [Apilactobacillus timberlakei]TPR23271.1 hypothetical protein DY102_04310 [Apilactobacillus timberlakei]